MPGKATRPDDGRHNNRGTIGNKGGRPPKPEGARKQRQTRAYDDEWELIKQFSALVKKDKEEAKKAIEKLDEAING